MRIDKFTTSTCLLLAILALLVLGWLITSDYSNRKNTQWSLSDMDLSSSLEFDIIGRSSEGRPIRAYCIGAGDSSVIIMGAIHGSEGNTAMLVTDLARYFTGMSDFLPPAYRFYFIPSVNPDGFLQNSRYNARGVDLNRNWDTHNWQSQTQGSNETKENDGGTEPFSEPETSALSNWLLDLQKDSLKKPIVISYHSFNPPSGLVQPGYRVADKTLQTDPASALLAQDIARELGYHYSRTFDQYPITGEAINWCADHDILSMDIELPYGGRLSSNQVQKHAHSILNSVKRMEGEPQ